MARKTNKLDLKPDARQVLSSDFNLFYKPQAKPEIAGMKELTASLNNFVNDAGAKMVIASEVKQKKVNEAQAIEEYNKNRTAFNERVNNGTLPKEANPYFIDKYKELELNTKAQIFSNTLGTKYAEMKVSENPDPEAFQKFYETEIKKYVAENNLGSYKPTDLEKGFFQKTSGFKAQLFQTHVSSQMANISEQYKINFQNNIQGFFDDSKSFEEIGAEISAFIIDKTANGLSNGSAQKYLLETLTDYAENTGNFEYAEKILEELPKHIQLGTGKFGDIKGLKDDLFQIKDKLQERADNKLSDDNTRRQNENTVAKLDAFDVADKYATLSEAKEGAEWGTLSNYAKAEVEATYMSRRSGFASQTEPNVRDELDKLITSSNFEEALEYLKNNQNRVQQAYYNDMLAVIKDYKISGNDGLLNSDVYEYVAGELQTLVDNQGKNKISLNYDPNRVLKLERKAIEWLSENQPQPPQYTKSKRRSDFEAWLRDQLNTQRDIIFKSSEVTGTKDDPEIADQTITF